MNKDFLCLNSHTKNKKELINDCFILDYGRVDCVLDFFLHIPDYALDDRGRRPCFSMDISSDCVFSCANYNFALFTY